MTLKRKNSPRNLYRRKAFKALTGGLLFGSAGSLIPNKWTKPVINAVMLPVHAQTTICAPDAVTITDPGTPSLRFEVDTYDYTVTAAGAAPFIFLLLQSPASATISSSGQILWDPENDYDFTDFIGVNAINVPFEVEVTDVNGCVSSLAWTVELTPFV